MRRRAESILTQGLLLAYPQIPPLANNADGFCVSLSVRDYRAQLRF